MSGGHKRPKLLHFRRGLALHGFRLGDTCLGVALDALLEAAQAFTEALAELRELAGAEHKKRYDEYENQVRRGKQIIQHAGLPAYTVRGFPPSSRSISHPEPPCGEAVPSCVPGHEAAGSRSRSIV